MKREKLIFVVVFMVCSFIGGRLFAGYELQKPTWSVVDCGASLTSGTTDYADGLDEGDSIGYRLDCSIGPLGDVHWEPDASPTGTIVESGFYHINYDATIENPTFVFNDTEISSTTIRFKLDSDNPAWTQYAIAFSTAVNPSGLFTGTTYYINKNGDTVTSWDEIEDWNPASFYEEKVELTQLHPNTIYGFKIRSKSAYEPPELPETDWSGDTDNYTWTHIETPDINVDVYITSATVTAGSFTNLGEGESRINFAIGGSWTGWATDTSWIFDNLTANTLYTFRVQARNGEMDETDVVSASKYTLCHPPENPDIPAVSVSSTSLTLVWSPPSSGTVEYYQIKENGVIIEPHYTQPSLDRTDLPFVNDEYTYKIYAVNTTNDTDEISSVTISTYTKCSIPSAPQIVDISADTISIEIYQGDDPGDNPYYTEFSIKVSSGGGDERFVQDDHTVGDNVAFYTTTEWGSPLIISNFGSNVVYDIYVQAMNEYGHVTDYGTSISSCTFAAVPALDIAEVGPASVRITILEGNNSPETEYAIYEWLNPGTGQWLEQGYLRPGGTISSGSPETAIPDWQTKDNWGGSGEFTLNLNLVSFGYKFVAKARRTITGYSKRDTAFSPPVYAGAVVQTPDALIGTYELTAGATEYYTSNQIVTFMPPGAEIHYTYTQDGSIPNDPITSDPDPSVTPLALTAQDGQALTYMFKAKAWQGLAKSDVGGPWIVVIDTAPPTIDSFSIREGDYTSDSRITLEISATGADEMYIDGQVENDVNTFEWIDYSTLKIVYLTPGDGPKTVNLKVRDKAGNETGPISDTITFEQHPPDVDFTINEAISTGQGVFVTTTVITLTILAENADSMKITGNVTGDNVNAWRDLPAMPQFTEEVTLEPGDVPKTVTVTIRNDTSGSSDQKSVDITLDTVVQTPILSLSDPESGSPNYTNNPVSVSIDNLDPEDVDWYILSQEAIYMTEPPDKNDPEWKNLPGTLPFTSDLSGDDGGKTVYLWVKDRVENISVEVASDTITLDRVPPQEGYLGIEQAPYTNSPNITLEISSTDDPYEMLIGRDVTGGNTGTWIAYATSQQVTLALPGDPEKTVTIKFRDETWNETLEIGSTTTLDVTPPVIEENIEAQFEKHDNEVLHQGEETTCHTPTFIVTATDILSGVDECRYSFSTDINAPLDNYIDTPPGSISIKQEFDPEDLSGTYYFRVKAIDNAGNPSEVKTFVYAYEADRVWPWASIDVENKKRIGDEAKGVEERNTLPEISFNEEVWGVEYYAEVVAIRDNEGKDISREVSCDINDKGGGVWEIDPQINWKSNYTYRVKVSTEIEDKAGNALEEGKELIFTTMLNHEEKNVVMWESEGDPEDPKTKMILEANALEEDGYILINLEPLKEAGEESKEAIKEADEKVKNNGDMHCYDLHESLREMRGYTRIGDKMEIENSGTVYIELPYEDNDDTGIVDSTEGTPAEVSEQTLSIYWLDEKHNLWVKVPGTEVNKKKNVARAKVVGFGIYTLMGGSFYDLSAAYAYPVPYKPNDGLTTTGDATSGITFTNLSSEAEIKIYTITGELVKKLTHKSGFVEEWYPVENEKGETVVSGVYIYYLKNDKEHKSGKLVIIR